MGAFILDYTNTAVIIPCYNEAVTIGKVIDDFHRELPGATVYVYDNNSTDGTSQIALEHGATVRLEPRQGKGNVCRQMFRDIDAGCYLMVDGDDTYPAEAARALCDPILAGEADMTVGDRLSNGTYTEENKRAFHGFGNNLVRAMINQPKVMMMDEPFRGLDAMTRALMQEYYVRLFEEHRGTNLFVTSELEEGIFLADRLVVLTNQPCQVKKVMDVNLPRPRTFDMMAMPEYVDIKREVLELLHDEAMKSFATGAVNAADFLEAYSQLGQDQAQPRMGDHK